MRIELTTPGLQDQCSSHWAMEAHVPAWKYWRNINPTVCVFRSSGEIVKWCYLLTTGGRNYKVCHRSKLPLGTCSIRLLQNIHVHQIGETTWQHEYVYFDKHRDRRTESVAGGESGMETLVKGRAPSEDRTHDPWFTRPVLYPLSYGGHTLPLLVCMTTIAM